MTSLQLLRDCLVCSNFNLIINRTPVVSSLGTVTNSLVLSQCIGVFGRHVHRGQIVAVVIHHVPEVYFGPKCEVKKIPQSGDMDSPVSDMCIW